MSITISIKFQDDAGVWHDLTTVPDNAFVIRPAEKDVEYQITHQGLPNSGLADLIDLTGQRCWQFAWLKDGQAAGLSVRRWMKFEAVSSSTIVLRMADVAARPL